MSYQQFRKVISLPPDPPRINNINYICIKYCPKALDHLTELKPNDQNLIITIYPSPAKDHLSFTFNNAQQYQNLELKCFNMLGLQQSESISLKGQQQISLNTINWKPGIYIGVLYSEGKTVGKEKFIVY